MRDLLSKNAVAVFQSATKSAASRARSVASELRLDVGGFAVEADIIISVRKIEQRTSEMGAPVTRLDLEWHAAKMPSLFPLMKAGLSILSVDRHRDPVGFHGRVRTPAWCLGKSPERGRRPSHRRGFGAPFH